MLKLKKSQAKLNLTGSKLNLLETIQPEEAKKQFIIVDFDRKVKLNKTLQES